MFRVSVVLSVSVVLRVSVVLSVSVLPDGARYVWQGFAVASADGENQAWASEVCVSAAHAAAAVVPEVPGAVQG